MQNKEEIKEEIKDRVEQIQDEVIDQVIDQVEDRFSTVKNVLSGAKNMSILSIIIISALGGGIVTGGTIWAVQKNNEVTETNSEIITAIGNLETKFEEAQANAVTNLTEPDLLKVPCSAEFISTHDKNALLCKEMFCRMNRQGGGQNSGGGAGATEQDCSAISGVSINLLKVQTCMDYWTHGDSNDQNSQFSRCVNQFNAQP